jgi:hypothetical protein
MPDPFANDIDHTQVDWAWTLGHRFLDAAQLCGFECDRTFVVDGQLAEAPPPSGDCTCSLAAIVTPGLSAPQDAGRDDPYCLPVFTASVVLVVDLCVLLPGSEEAAEPALVDAAARDIQSSLWQIMQGLMKARSDHTLVGIGPSIEPGPWEAAGQQGGNARWQTRWSYRS